MKNKTSKHLYFIFALGTGLLLAAGLSIGASRAGGALLYVDPQTSTAGPGESVFTSIQLGSASNVAGVDLLMSFDPAIVQVMDADSGSAGVQISTGDCPQPDYIIKNEVDNLTGTLQYAVSHLNPTLPCSGGEVASIEFQCVGVGTSEINISPDTILAGPDFITITYTAQNGGITCTNTTSTPGPTATATATATPTETPTPTPTPILEEKHYLPGVIKSAEKTSLTP